MFWCWADRGAALLLHRRRLRRWRPSWFGCGDLGLRGATRTGLAAGVRPTGQPERPWPKLRALGRAGRLAARPSRFPQVVETPRRDRSTGASDARPDGQKRSAKLARRCSGRPSDAGGAPHKQAARGRTEKQPAHAERQPAARGRTSMEVADSLVKDDDYSDVAVTMTTRRLRRGRAPPDPIATPVADNDR